MKKIIDGNLLPGLMIVLIIALAFAASGCSTAKTKTAEYCETTTDKVWLVTYSGTTSDCVDVSVEGAEGEISLPIGGDE